MEEDNESDKDDNADVISGSVVGYEPSLDSYKFQLIACMEKMAAELALLAVERQMLFSIQNAS